MTSWNERHSVMLLLARDAATYLRRFEIEPLMEGFVYHYLDMADDSIQRIVAHRYKMPLWPLPIQVEYKNFNPLTGLEESMSAPLFVTDGGRLVTYQFLVMNYPVNRRTSVIAFADWVLYDVTDFESVFLQENLYDQVLLSLQTIAMGQISQ